MTTHPDRSAWAGALSAVLEETFERVQGIYLDRGTALLETLADVSAEEASRRVAPDCACVAAQVVHVCYYLDVLLGYMRRQPPERADWPGSWSVTAVTPAEWDALRQRLRDTYQQVRAQVQGLEARDGADEFSEALAIVVHTAYHLGEIRQALGVLRGSP